MMAIQWHNAVWHICMILDQCWLVSGFGQPGRGRLTAINKASLVELLLAVF